MIKLRGLKSNSSVKESVPQIWSYPGYGYPLPSGDWKLVVSGLACLSPTAFSMRQRMMIRMLGNVMQASPEELQCELFQNRISPFMAEADHRKRISVTIDDRSHRLNKKTKRNGHFRDRIIVDADLVERSAITDEHGNRSLPISVSIDGNQSLTHQSQVQLIPNSGTSIVSDIDDTIKISAVGDRRELLTNTFLRKFRGVDGMADLYQQWARAGASFHYVSSSPWQLYGSLQGLHTDLAFPHGTMHLRNFRLRDQLFKKIRLRRHGKVSAIRDLMKSLPQRQFVLIGDSGEKDPEIYRKICRQFPGRVRGLFIRELPQRPISEERFEKIKNSLPHGVCERFPDAQALAKAANALFA